MADELLKAGEKIAGELLQSETPVLVQKVSQSTGSKVMAAGLPVAGVIVTALLGAFGNLNGWQQTIIICVALLAGGAVWNESKRRQNALQLALIEKAASRHAHTVEIEPESAKAG
jgi:hypothetical protein